MQGNRYGCDVTLSKPLTPSISASLTAGVSNERYLETLTGNYRTPEPEFRAMLRLFIRPTETANITASYDSLSRLAGVSAYETGIGERGRWEASVNGQHDGFGNRAIVTGSAAYFGNREEIRVTHTGSFDGVGYGGFSPGSTDERSSVRVGGAIAFADGKVAVGPPIRTGSFAIVALHESLADTQAVVGESSNARARTDALGPALIPNLPAYTPVTIAVDVPDAPIGYSLGAGTFDLYPPYKAGYALQVGSAYSVTAYGTLLMPNGDPLGSFTGVATSTGDPNRQVEVFTNSAGRFAADGLAGGRWRLRMETDAGQQDYQVDVPEGAIGLHKVGTLSPSGSL